MILKNKVVLITGSSRGIGAAIAMAMGKKGAKVVVNYNKNKKRAEKAVDSIGDNAIAIQADVTKSGEVKRLFKEIITNYKTLDILINNASVTFPKSFPESTEKHWREQFDSSFFSAVWCSKEASKIMKKNKSGKIINISSIRGLNNYGRSGIIAYSAAKAALISFTKTLAKELSPHIQVNGVAPGFTFTENYLQFSKRLQKQFIDNTLLKKWIMPENVANLVVFIAEDDVMAGDVIPYDAGYTLMEAG